MLNRRHFRRFGYTLIDWSEADMYMVYLPDGGTSYVRKTEADKRLAAAMDAWKDWVSDYPHYKFRRIK